jgi:hypothetical protein
MRPSTRNLTGEIARCEECRRSLISPRKIRADWKSDPGILAGIITTINLKSTAMSGCART